MKKKILANLIMVLLILVISISGIALAFTLRNGEDTGLGSQYRINAISDNGLITQGEEDTGLGSQYHITKIPDNALITQGEERNICTITIVCDTILDNLDNLDKEKVPYVPKDAVILPETKVSFSEGDTVFEVLQKVCEAANLQIEYSWTPMYNSYYIEGINHLYEFDCGHESGWMYKVNEWFPNYGCSAYTLKNGDEIVWCYTCKGLGADVGEVRKGDE